VSIKTFFNKPTGKAIRLIIAFIPVFVIFIKIDWHKMILAVMATAWWTVPILLLSTIISMFLQGYRWWLLLKPFAPLLSLGQTLRAHFLGLYYSIILPTSAAQDVVRATILSKNTDFTLSWASTWMSRILGLLALFAMSIYGLFGLKKYNLPSYFLISLSIAFAFLLLLFLFSFSKRFSSPIRGLFSRFIPEKFLQVAENIRQAIYNYRDQPGIFIYVFVITLLVQLTTFLGACFVIYGITGKLLLFESIVFLPIIEIICMTVPLTPNGIGLREGMLAIMFRQAGLSKESLGIFIVLGFLSISMKLFGSIAFLFPEKKKSIGV
jgi:glycosyltransferase 2 family protein